MKKSKTENVKSTQKIKLKYVVYVPNFVLKLGKSKQTNNTHRHSCIQLNNII